jgi:hypothetical protein
LLKFQPLIIFVGLSLLLGSCSRSSRIIYAKYGKLKLTGQEVNSYPVNGNDVQAFENCCYTGIDAIFLNRAIHEKDGKYDIYIAVSEQLMPAQFQQLMASNESIGVISTSSALVNKTKVDAYMLQNGQVFITRFVYVETKSGLLVIYDITSKQESVVRAFYDDMSNYLDDKIRL